MLVLEATLNGRPTADGLKQLGAALASYGSLALFHLVGVTPEARSVEEALQGHPAQRELVVPPGALAATYASFVPQTEQVDLVVFGTPQLSLLEMRHLARLFQGRRVHPGTRVFLTTSDAVKAVADHLGYCAILEGAGATVLTGVCYYIMTAREMAARHGFRTLLTDSAKLANIIAGYGYVPLFRPTELCVDAALHRAPRRGRRVRPSRESVGEAGERGEPSRRGAGAWCCAGRRAWGRWWRGRRSSPARASAPATTSTASGGSSPARPTTSSATAWWGRCWSAPRPKGASPRPGCCWTWCVAGWPPWPSSSATTNPVMVQGAVLAGVTLLHRLEPDPQGTLRTGDYLRVDPAAGTVEVLAAPAPRGRGAPRRAAAEP